MVYSKYYRESSWYTYTFSLSETGLYSLKLYNYEIFRALNMGIGLWFMLVCAVCITLATKLIAFLHAFPFINIKFIEISTA